MAEGKIKDQSFLKKLENIWLYYKWYILAGILAILFIGLGLKQCMDVTKPDAGIIFVTSKQNEFTPMNAEEVKIFVEENYMTDFNGDGEISCNVTHVVLDTTLQSFGGDEATQRQNLLLNLGNNENFIIICDDECYEYLCSIEMAQGVTTGVFEPVKGYINDQNAEELRVSLTGTKLGDMGTLKEKGAELYLGLRLYKNSGAENDKKATELFNYSCEVADKILADKSE